MTGDAGANVINGNGGSDTINGGDGNDTIYVGSPDTYIVKPQATHNSTTATAIDLDSSFVETYASFIQNSTTIPHATVLATASGGLEYYKLHGDRRSDGGVRHRPDNTRVGHLP